MKNRNDDIESSELEDKEPDGEHILVSSKAPHTTLKSSELKYQDSDIEDLSLEAHDTLKPVNISNEAEGSEDNEIITPETKSETFQIKIDEHEQNFEVSAAERFESAINDFTDADKTIEMNENTAAMSGIDEPIN